MRPYQQLWFPGDHGSVGGGGDITGLSDDALRWVVEGAALQGLWLPPSFIEAAARSVDYNAPLANVSTQKWSFTSIAMSMVKNDRAGPQLLRDVAPSARKRWARSEYRPGTLKWVALDLDRPSAAEAPMPASMGEPA